MRTDTRRFITIAFGMPSHPKIVDLSDKAFRLLVETWLWCAEHGTDGEVSAARWRKLATPRARGELEAARLVVSVAKDTFVMHDFLQHQRSKADLDSLSDDRAKASALGNHKRWHEARGVVDERCSHCTTTDPKPDRKPIANRSQVGSQMGSQNDRKPIAEVEVDKEQEPKGPMGAAHLGNARPQKGASGPNASTAFRLVRATLGSELTTTTRTALTIEVGTLLAEADPDLIVEALHRWNARTGIGPRMLPALVDDIRKEARGATSRPAPVAPTVNALDARAAALLAGTAYGPPELRALPGGAS